MRVSAVRASAEALRGTMSAVLSSRLAYALALAACVALTVLCRLPFLHVPLTNDEGGYADVARLWAHGARLYGDAWVDRPQGLVLLFRLFVAIAPSTEGLRLCAALYAAASAILLAYVGSKLYGRAAGLCAAFLYAVFSSGPQIEGFIVDGELLATLPAVAAVALLLRSREVRSPGRYLFLAGIAAGLPLLIKQSAIDGPVIVALFALAGKDTALSVRLRRLLLVVLGIAMPLLLSALHGALIGWHDYLDAVVLDNLRYRSFDASSNTPGHALDAFAIYWSEDAFLVLAALIALVPLVRGRGTWDAFSWLPLPWLALTVFGVTLGGLYSRHYFVQILPPLCLLAGLGLVAAARAALRRAALGLLLLVPLAALAIPIRTDAAYYARYTPVAISRHLYGWPVYTYQAALVSFLQRRVPPGQPFFVAYAAAPLHYLSERPSVTRYLWRRPLGTIPGAYEAALRAVERAVPVCVIPVQPVTQPPGDARMRVAIARHYSVAWQRPGITVYCRRPK